jgi:Holliday junction DNA helicase RuvA
LIDKWNAWKKAIDDSKLPYYNLSIEKALGTSKYLTENAKLVDLEGELTSLQNIQSVIIQGETEIDGFEHNESLASIKEKIKGKQDEVDAQESVVNSVLAESSASSCVVDVNGVGYEMLIPVSTFEKLPHPGEKVKLLVHMQVREDAITLFGFYSSEEKQLFCKLIDVSGVGGKLALNVLSTMPAGNFSSAIAAGDVKAISRISGIGKRTAERLIVELKGKLDLTGSSDGASVLSSNEAVNDAALALEQLGFKRDAVNKTLNTLIAEIPVDEQTSEKLLRAAIMKLKF